MFKEIAVHANFNERTGYGIHSSRFFPKLDALMQQQRGGKGTVHISLLDVVTASQTTIRHPAPSILFTVWESSMYPDAFMDKLKLYDQLWVPSETQRSWSIAQGVPEEFVRVVPEGVDPDFYKPLDVFPESDTFNFLVVGQYQPRKSTLEIIQSFLKAFPDNPKVRLYLSVDTLFPSDNYKSTEERLAGNGIFDDRIIPIHFEERASYLRRLQTCHVYVQCSRSEGWGLPGIEAMACGAVAIMEGWGGSTEYSAGALLVRVPELRKPHGIYGGWDVPGQWGEPDYDHLVEVMRDSYENYSAHKENALKSAERIRRDFSWDKAAEKAMIHLEEMSNSLSKELPTKSLSYDKIASDDVQADVIEYARKRGFEITGLKKIDSAIFTVHCWPNSDDKMATLVETIHQIHGLGYQVLVSSHFPLPPEVIKLTDYYVYEQRDIMSGDDKPVYWRKKPDGTVEHKQCTYEYQGVAALNCFRNAIDFCRGKWDWIYDMGADMEVDLKEWLRLVKECPPDKDMVCIPYEGIKNGIGGGLWAGRTEFLAKVAPVLNSWKEYADKFPDVRFVAERWVYNHVASLVDIEKHTHWISIETTNRFDNVDRTLWGDEFQLHFVEGPFLNILGNSGEEYDVEYSNPIDGVDFALKQKSGAWSKPTKRYYRDWSIKASLNGELKFEHKLDLKGKNVLISMGSKALGDTIAWMPYIEEFRKKHGCNVVCAGWWQEVFDYPEIQYIKPGTVVKDLYASYDVGCFDEQLDKNVANWRSTILQKVAADILGIDYKPIRAKLKFEPHKRGNGNRPKPYICFSEYSTMQNKLWNRPGAWQKVIDHLNGLGYDCVAISAEKSNLQNVVDHHGQSIQMTLADIAGCDFYVGLNHGPAWIAYCLNKPCVMITGVSEEWNDFPNPYRISIDTDCRPCFNDTSVPISRDWAWCYSPDEKYKCTARITEEMVFEMIDKIREEHYALKNRASSDDVQNRETSPGEIIQEKPGGFKNVEEAVDRV